MNNIRMKQILLAGVLSFGAFVSPVLTPPAAAQTQMQSVKDMAGWMQEVTTIEIDLMKLFSADSMANIYSVLDSDDDEAIMRLGQQFEAERQAVLARARRQIDELSPPEKWNINRSLFSRQDQAIYSAAKNQFNALEESYSLFATLTNTLSEILNNPEDLDDERFVDLLNVQYDVSVRLIELENRQIDGYIAAIPKTNPNHQFQKIVKQFNLSAISELNISMFDISLDERRSYGETMGEALDKIRPLIREGQKNTKNELNKLQHLTTQDLVSSERAMIPIIIKLYENFEQTFEVETKILKTMQSSYELYTSDKTDEEIQPTIDENDLAFFRLIETRAEFMQYRLSLLQ